VWQEWCRKHKERKSRRKDKHREKDREGRDREGRRERSSRADSRDHGRESIDVAERASSHKQRPSEAPEGEDRGEREREVAPDRDWEKRNPPPKRRRAPDSEGGTPRSVRRIGDEEAPEGGLGGLGGIRKDGSFDVEDGEV
jgi:hypothetical protein